MGLFTNTHVHFLLRLSAFVLQTFCDARNYATIDDNVIEELITFLTTRQAPNGAIIEMYDTSRRLIVSALILLEFKVFLSKGALSGRCKK